ncbi:hypothetical protein [Variovorax ginsengisoli]|uniref:Type IV secretory pathway VirB10-like protein n=1 Tax=Variovorax ginsengisoli TaxID=363844 RepID=A0ABT9S7G4_9BURK|nr:hypothetical protein [Variovorax ginsengisoli]MDP9900140.1 type IV secretory pathway VirB10-like protein [Variovorax ginsengisoli]
MKILLCALSIAVAAVPLLGAPDAAAQAQATAGNTDFAAERARLAAQRQAMEQRVKTQQAECYQRFVVESCLSDVRAQRRKEDEDIKRQEAAMNDIERKQRGAAQLDALDQKNATPRPEDALETRARSVEQQAQREQRAADNARSREAAAAESAQKRRDFESKQRTAAQDQAKAAERRAESPALARDYEQKLQKAAEHRADVERKNAERTKPRSAPLPAPP